MGYFPIWRPARGATVLPDERLPMSAALPMSVQHLLAMSGSTILAPLLMGFDPNVAVLFSGIGTLLFFVLTGGRVPSYLGSSFAFIAVVIAATGYAGSGPNPNIAVALGGIVVTGLVYALIGLLVMASGTGWIERLMPPAVTGAIGVAIGLNLAPVAVRQLAGTAAHTGIALATVLCMALISVHGPQAMRRVAVLLALAFGYGLVLVLGNGLGVVPGIDFARVAAAPWFGMPQFVAPRFEWQAISMIAPVAIVLVAENLGHIKALGAITGQNMDRYIGRGFLGDGLATMLAGAGGGTGVTTYAENIGVMAMTRVYSTLIFPLAAAIAILLGLSPKFGAILQTIPASVLAGLAVAVFGLIASAMARIWVDNRVDFSQPRNLFPVGVALILGAGDFTVTLGGFALGGIGTSTLAALVLYQLLGMGQGAQSTTQPQAEATTDR
ncbi:MULTISPECIES: solute carrier family 23 protein [unclassified Paracoccus (in: a-proteobacteria)]|uniref:solute carrier family 23 protein n=1 Tax=unclassified Paracoccus (in: a-proteobacteria) TaxID=2688777 RepID=UPI0012B303FC|nr:MULTISPECIES: solute carrier family 23 protein [unclassified Paracoccus (in: a-proteobacteria)]UXU76643.1 NCS2 family nucleobase:cation symporter [Paracoccus sp. SMMA_5]UXU82532.1 NCS2 family nucleobase:cation symporter [Paracoccus sp. SMMA_5_TC]